MHSAAAFRRAVDRFPDRPAVVTPAGEAVTYAELDARTDALAAALDARLGDARCAGLLKNGRPAVETMVAGLKRGRATVQLSFRAAVDDLVSMLDVAGPGGLVVEDATADLADRALERVDLDVVLYAGEADLGADAEAYEAALADAPDGYESTAGADDESAVYFTSGTTSRPKAVLQDQDRAWVASAQALMELSLTPEDTLLVTTPWYHGVTTLAWLFPTLYVGGTAVLHADFDPHASLEAVETHGVTGVLAVPTQLEALVAAQREGGYDLSSLRLIRTGGAVVRPELVEAAREHLTEGVHNTYGMTEAFANLTHAYPDEQLDHPGTVGNRSFAWEALRVVEAADPDAEPDAAAEVDPGETGEVLARGPHADGYLDHPEAEARLFVDATDPDGGPVRWLRTGDVARVDEAGGLHIVDRVDNMLVSGGENVYPQVVERVLLGHPDVEDVAVVGVPDETWGEQVAAVVVGDVTADELDAYCRDHDGLADFKRPRRYAFADEALPRSDTGTLPRPRIVEDYFG